MADYGFEHNGQVFTPNGSAVAIEDNTARNAAIEQAELAHWRMRPREMSCYYRSVPEPIGRSYREAFRFGGGSVTTWTGATLGTIINARVYRHNFGARMVSMRVRGTNGAMYHGRASWDNGDCIRLHRSK